LITRFASEKECGMKLLFWMLALLVSTINLGLAQEITVATEEFPPFNYTENGKLLGISTEVVEAILARAMITAEIKVYPWARCYGMVSERANVIAFSMGRTPDRENLFIWIGPIAPAVKTVLFKLKQRSDILIPSLEEAKKYKIGIVRASGGHKVLLQHGFENEENIFPVAQLEQNLKKLFSGRIDLLFYNNMSVMTKAKNMGLPVAQIEEAFVFGEFGTYLAINKQTDETIVKKIRTAFEQLQAEGVVKDIAKKYLSLLT
jgi:polar amino acid transport system substrate-binding protein